MRWVYILKNNKYIYSYTDHLGNVRVSYFKNTGGSAEVLEENNYYPFGMKHTGYNTLAGNPAYLYQYNGKELQEMGMYDYGARFYMPDVGRWGVVDPLAEVTPHVSSYHYANNNPLMYNDPTGMVSQSFMDNVWNSSSGTTWYNTGTGFVSDGGSAMDYDGNNINWGRSYMDMLMMRVGLGSMGEGGGVAGTKILPELVINVSKWKYAFTGNYLFNNDRISIFNHLDKYIGVMSTITQWDGDRGFRGNWANSDNFWAGLSYSLFNNFYLGLQMVDTFDWLGTKSISGYNGRITFSNLDGTSQFDSGNRLMAFATTFNPFGPKMTLNVPATFGAVGESVLPQAAFRLTDDLAPLSASQFSMLFKGTSISRATPATRGFLNSYLNKGLNGVNSVGLYRTVAPATAKAILPYNGHNNW